MVKVLRKTSKILGREKWMVKLVMGRFSGISEATDGFLGRNSDKDLPILLSCLVVSRMHRMYLQSA